MPDAPASARRRDRGRAPRSTGPTLAPMPRLINRWPPLQILSEEQVERILLAAFRILEEAGLEIRSAAAREIYARGGALVDEATQMVRLGREVIEAHLAHAPPRFVLHARNAERHLQVGDNVVNFGPVTGAPNIRDEEGGRRYGDLEAFRNILKLTHTLGVLHWQGGIVVEPVDVPVNTRHLDMVYAHMRYSDKPFMGSVTTSARAADSIEMCRLLFGADFLESHCVILGNVNVNSPLVLDGEAIAFSASAPSE